MPGPSPPLIYLVSPRECFLTKAASKCPLDYVPLTSVINNLRTREWKPLSGIVWDSFLPIVCVLASASAVFRPGIQSVGCQGFGMVLKRIGTQQGKQRRSLKSGRNPTNSAKVHGHYQRPIQAPCWNLLSLLIIICIRMKVNSFNFHRPENIS